jgi:hypothetical protein
VLQPGIPTNISEFLATAKQGKNVLIVFLFFLFLFSHTKFIFLFFHQLKTHRWPATMDFVDLFRSIDA